MRFTVGLQECELISGRPLLFFYPTAVAASLATVLPQKEEGPMGDRCQLLCPGMYTPSAARARAAVSFI